MANVINIKKFIDVSSSISATPQSRRDFRNILLVQKGTDAQATVLTSYTSLDALITGEGSSTASAKMATSFFGGGLNGVTPSCTVYVAKIGAADATEFTTNFSALLSNPNYYYIAMDNQLSAHQSIAAAAVEASSVSHFLFCLDTNTDCINKTAAQDNSSITAILHTNNYNKSAAVYTDSAKADSYPNVSMCSIYATSYISASSPLPNAAFKTVSGVTAIDFTGATSTIDTCWDNIAAKNGNAYITLGETGRVCFQSGVTGSGSNIEDYVAADYLDYTITYNVYDLLNSVSRLPMTEAGASKLAMVISRAFEDLYQAGVIAAGTSLDDEVFTGHGYKLAVSVPTGTYRAQGIWNSIECAALLAGACKKVVITNQIKL